MNKQLQKYGIYFCCEPYYGRDFTWETYIDTESSSFKGPCKEEVIEQLEEEIDVLSSFISPKEILDFTKSLKDTAVGNDLYDHLCQNLAYIDSIYEKACSITSDIARQFTACVWGETEAYSTDDQCHLRPFEKGGHLQDLLKSPETFIEWFQNKLARIDKKLFALLFQNISMKEIITQDAQAKIAECDKQIEYHLKQLDYYKTERTRELARLKCLNKNEEKKGGKPNGKQRKSTQRSR